MVHAEVSISSVQVPWKRTTDLITHRRDKVPHYSHGYKSTIKYWQDCFLQNPHGGECAPAPTLYSCIFTWSSFAGPLYQHFLFFCLFVCLFRAFQCRPSWQKLKAVPVPWPPECFDCTCTPPCLAVLLLLMRFQSYQIRIKSTKLILP